MECRCITGLSGPNGDPCMCSPGFSPGFSGGMYGSASIVCSGGCACDQLSGAASGTISDGTSDYSNNANCVWLIAADDVNILISLSFSSFNTESGWDYVTVNSCVTSSCSSVDLVARLSGSSVNSGTTYTSSTGYLQLVFTSDSSVTGSGFVAQWSTEARSCTACAAGTYKAGQGNAPCMSCPADSDSPAGSTACTCNAGSSGPDGGSCELCSSGTYKTTTGSLSCDSCALNATSVAGSTSPIACFCNPGYFNNPSSAIYIAGFIGQYYAYTPEMQSPDFPGFSNLTPALTYMDLLINFESKAAFRWHQDAFAARWTGQIRIDSFGEYIFETNSDDGSWVWVNEALVVDNGGTHPMQTRSGSIVLAAGYHDFRVHFFDYSGDAGLIVRYKGPDTSKSWTLLNGYTVLVMECTACAAGTYAVAGRSMACTECVEGKYKIGSARIIELVPGSPPRVASLSSSGSAPLVSASLPSYNAVGGPGGKGDINFDRSSSQYLDGGAHTFNMASGGGLTAVAVVKFEGSAGIFERIFDFGNGAESDNIILYRRFTTEELLFEIRNGATTVCKIVQTNAITQDAWITIIVRYNAQDHSVELMLNGTVVSSGTCSQPSTDRSLTRTYIGKSNWPSDDFLSGSIAGVLVVDTYLDTAAATLIADRMVQGDAILPTQCANCVSCPAHSNAPAGSSLVTDCQCNAGFAKDGSACDICTPGTYKTQAGNQACTPCIAGKYSAAAADCSIDDCIEHSVCIMEQDTGRRSTVAPQAARENVLASTFLRTAEMYSGKPEWQSSANEGTKLCWFVQDSVWNIMSGGRDCSDETYLRMGYIHKHSFFLALPATGNTYAGRLRCGSTSSAVCLQCPSEFSSSPTGSTAIEQCTCNAGFSGPNGGPCTPNDSATICAPGSAATWLHVYNGNYYINLDETINWSEYYPLRTSWSKVRLEKAPSPGDANVTILLNDFTFSSSNGQTSIAHSVTAMEWGKASDCRWSSGGAYPCPDTGPCTSSFSLDLVGTPFQIQDSPSIAWCYGPPISESPCLGPAGPTGFIPLGSVSCEITSCSGSVGGHCGYGGFSTLDTAILIIGRNATLCTICAPGTFSSASDATTCQSCPSNSNSPAQSTTSTACTCNAGFSGAKGGMCIANTCGAGSFRQSDFFQTAQGTFDNVKEACHDGGGQLASIHSLEENNEVAGLCTPGVNGWCYIGLVLNVTDMATWYWLDGSAFDYTQWDTNEPQNSGETKTALTEKTRNGDWSDFGTGQYELTGVCRRGRAECRCNAGFSGPNGGLCTECVTGTYKATSGDATCESCPANSDSSAGSITITACTCNSGSSGPDGGPCDQCAAGTYKMKSGDAGCKSCPANATSPAGSIACKCNTGTLKGCVDDVAWRSSTSFTCADYYAKRFCANDTYGLGWNTVWTLFHSYCSSLQCQKFFHPPLQSIHTSTRIWMAGGLWHLCRLEKCRRCRRLSSLLRVWNQARGI